MYGQTGEMPMESVITVMLQYLPFDQKSRLQRTWRNINANPQIPDKYREMMDRLPIEFPNAKSLIDSEVLETGAVQAMKPELSGQISRETANKITMRGIVMISNRQLRIMVVHYLVSSRTCARRRCHAWPV